jgi:hypothetical protein
MNVMIELIRMNKFQLEGKMVKRFHALRYMNTTQYLLQIYEVYK